MNLVSNESAYAVVNFELHAGNTLRNIAHTAGMHEDVLRRSLGIKKTKDGRHQEVIKEDTAEKIAIACGLSPRDLIE